MSIAKHLAETKLSARVFKNDWLNLTVAGAARVILLAAASLLLWALIPGALGWHVTTTMSGSMEPKVMTGDVVVSMPYDGDKVMTGQVILAPDPAKPDHLRFHRVLKPGPNGTVITKGDNNAQADSDPTKRSAIVGVGVIRIPGLGLPALWMQQHQWLPLGVALLGLPLLFLLSSRDRYLRHQLEAARREEAVSLGKNPDPFYVRALKQVTPTRVHHAGPHLKAGASIALVLVLVGSTVTLRGSDSGFASIDQNTGNLTTTPSVWDCWNQGTAAIYYGFNDASTSVTDVTNAGTNAAANGIITGAANTKTGSNCTTTSAGTGSPFLNLDGSTSSRLYSDTSIATRSQGVAVAFKTSTKRAVVLAALSDTRGNNTAANTWASISLDADGTYTTSVAFENTSGANSCTSFAGSTVLTDNKWHYLSAGRTSTTSSQRVDVYLDGVSQQSVISSQTTGALLKMAAGSTKSYTGWLRSGYSQGTTGTCSDSTHTARYLGAIDEIASPDYGSSEPGLH